MGLKDTDKYSSVKSEIRALAESLRKISSLFFSPVRLEMIHILAASRCQTYYSLMAELSLSRTTINYHTNMLFLFGLIEKGEMSDVIVDERGNKYGTVMRTFTLKNEFRTYLEDIGYFKETLNLVRVMREIFFIYTKHMPQLLPFTNEELRWWDKELSQEEIIKRIDEYQRIVERYRRKLLEKMGEGELKNE